MDSSRFPPPPLNNVLQIPPLVPTPKINRSVPSSGGRTGRGKIEKIIRLRLISVTSKMIALYTHGNTTRRCRTKAGDSDGGRDVNDQTPFVVRQRRIFFAFGLNFQLIVRASCGIRSWHFRRTIRTDGGRRPDGRTDNGPAFSTFFVLSEIRSGRFAAVFESSGVWKR